MRTSCYKYSTAVVLVFSAFVIFSLFETTEAGPPPLMNFGINKSLKMLQRVNMLNSKHSEENPSDEDYDKELVRLSGTKINDAQRELRDRYAKELLRRLTQISSLMRRKSAIAAYSNF